jgi:ATP-dependent DNA helicase RecQ
MWVFSRLARSVIARHDQVMELTEALAHYFGHAEFRSGQEKVIRSLLARKSALAIFPTGGGKSLCYQLPALLLPGLTLVVSPLIALMKDQVESLVKRGLPAARLDSTLNAEEVLSVFEQMCSGQLKLLYIAPERFANETFLKHLKKTKISLLAIDEAHCISEWGHNFRPDYLRLAKIAQQFKLRPVLALTATATTQVAEEMAVIFNVKKGQRVVNSFQRANLALHVTPCPALTRLEMLTQKITFEAHLPAIVYVTQQHTAEHVATHLAQQGLKAQAYHAGLPDEHRGAVQSAFMAGETEIIVATIAFGMGIDKANVRAVYHYNLPKTLENYQQEIGRAGRDGAPAHVEVLACQDDLTLLRNFIHGDTPTPTALRQLVDHLLRRGRDVDVSHYELTRVTDIRPAVMETVLTYLEMEGLLEPCGSFYAQYRLAFERPEAQVLSGYPGKHRQMLEQIFAGAKRWWKWLTVDLEATAGNLATTSERIVTALQDLEQAGEIVLKPGKRRQRYRLRADVTTELTEAACAHMQALFARREAADLARLEQVLTLMQDHRCLSKHLLGYFGEKLRQPCGTCTSCQEKLRRPRRIPATKTPTITDAELVQIQALIDEKLPALRSPRQLTRFLCGIRSPATQRDRLLKHDTFGLLENVPFAEVLCQLETMIVR